MTGLRAAFFAALCAATCWALLVQPVYVNPAALDPRQLAGFRIAFGVLLLLRLMHFVRAPRLVWPQGRLAIGPLRIPLLFVLMVWAASAGFLVVGLVTPLSALTCFLVGILVMARSWGFSIEDILFQTVALTLPFLDLSAAWSVDAALGIPTRPPIAVSMFGLNLLWLLMAGLMTSAGFEKLLSPLWRAGQGFNSFVQMPHLVQKRFVWLRRFTGVGVLLSWATVIAEFGAIFGVFSVWIRVALIVVLIGFAISLMSVVDISFIGQLMGVVFGVLLVLDVQSVGASHGDPATWPALWLVLPVLLLALTWWVMADLPLPRPLRMVVRLTSGIMPIRVFTERHVGGVYIFRVLDESQRSLVPAFDEDGSPGRAQRWHPRIFQSAMYPITDLALSVARDGVEAGEASRRLPFALDLMATGAEWSRQPVGALLVLEVSGIEKSAEGFGMTEWTPLVTAKLGADGFEDVKLSVPIKIESAREP